MPSRLLLQELTRVEAKAIAPDTLVILPTGATEQHGPHLPVGMDSYGIEHIARSAAAVVADRIPVVVTPTLPFGSSAHHLPFGGTMSLTTETYFRTVFDLAESLIIGGFRRIFILNGHGGNHEVVQLVARDLALKHPAHLAAASYWTIAWDALVAAEANVPGRLPGHAGAFETSLVMALRPELVSEPRPHRDNVGGAVAPAFATPYRAEHHGRWQQINGFTDSPDRATAERGEAYLRATVEAVGAAFVEFFASCEETA